MTLAPALPFSDARPTRIGYAALVALAIVFALWSALAPVSGAITFAAAIGDARHQPQIMATDTALVTELAVRDGQAVAKGQILLRLNADDLIQQRALANARYDTDRLARARALAIIAGKPAPDWPDDLSAAITTSPDPADRAATEQHRLDADRAEAAALTDANRLQHRATTATLAALADQTTATLAERVIITADLATQASLKPMGLALTAATSQLQRDLSELDGTLARLAATRATAEAQEAQADLDLTRQRAALVATADADLRQIDERLQATASDRARLTAAIEARTLRAPLAGIIADLQLAASGETVIAGRPILRIIPPDEGRIATAHIPTDQIGTVQTGMDVHLDLPRSSRATTDPITGTIADISPAPVTLNAKGDVAFLARIRLDPRPQSEPLPPGLTVNVTITTGPERLAARLLAPLTDIFTTP